MKMSRMSPLLKEVQEKYKDDPQRQNAEIQALYKREGVSLGGSCLWSLLPLLILIPLYSVVRQPIMYMLGETQEVADAIVNVIKTANPELFTNKAAFYEQMIAARLIPEFKQEILAVLPNLSAATLEGVQFSFLGFDLSTIPQYNIFAETWVWNCARAALFPFRIILHEYLHISSLFPKSMIY